jgi:hypothetical protein
MERDYVSEIVLGPIVHPQMIYEYGKPWWNDTYRGKLNNSVKDLSECHFVHHKFYMN